MACAPRGPEVGRGVSTPPQKTLPSHTRWCKIILWVRFTLGNIFGFRAESRSEGTARALTPDQQDGVGEKPLLLLQKNLFFQTLCRQAGKTALYPECPAAKKLRTTLALPLKSLWHKKRARRDGRARQTDAGNCGVAFCCIYNFMLQQL